MTAFLYCLRVSVEWMAFRPPSSSFQLLLNRGDGSITKPPPPADNFCFSGGFGFNCGRSDAAPAVVPDTAQQPPPTTSSSENKFFKCELNAKLGRNWGRFYFYGSTIRPLASQPASLPACHQVELMFRYITQNVSTIQRNGTVVASSTTVHRPSIRFVFGRRSVRQAFLSFVRCRGLVGISGFKGLSTRTELNIEESRREIIIIRGIEKLQLSGFP